MVLRMITVIFILMKLYPLHVRIRETTTIFIAVCIITNYFLQGAIY